jgi:hypothetical protein
MLAVGSLVLAGIVVSLVIFWGTRTDAPTADPDGRRTLTVGFAESRYENLRDEGPLYWANPFGGDGIWLALEDDEIVALALRVPGRPDCTVNWRGRDDTFKDCDDQPIAMTELDRYEVTIPTEGDTAGQVVVDLDVLIPAPTRP